TSFEGDNRIQMLRALARFDVGFNFNKAGGVTTGNESFKGLTGYTLQTVHVYRTRDKAAVIPLSDNYDTTNHKVTAPSVLGDIKNTGAQGSGDTGLTYTVDPTLGATVRDIYLPENNADQATVIVVGVEDGDGHLGYYKMALDANADGNDDPVLRNYRYVFSITGINGRGQDKPEDALHTVEADIHYQVVDWDEQAEDAYISGNYYFKLSDRTVQLPVNKNDDVQLTYETNLPADKIAWAWDTTATTYSDAVSYTLETPVTVNGVTTGALTFHAPSNSTGVVIVNPLQFTAADIQGTVTVTQNYIPMNYGLNCSSIKVYGGYMINTYPDKTVNYIEMELTDIVDDMLGATWIVETTAFNGLSFRGTGTFTKLGKQKVMLYPDESQLMTPGGAATLDITCNSTSETLPTNCTVDVTIGFKKKKILTIDTGTGYGYATWNTGSGSYAFMHSTANFGFNGTVPIEGIEYTHITGGSVSNSESTLITADPDIIIIGYNADWNNNSTVGTALLNYVNRGGVLVLLYEQAAGENTNADPSTGNDQRITGLFDNEVTYDNAAGGGSGTMYDLSCDQADDPIFSGKVNGLQYFPSLEGTQWGEDASSTSIMKIVPGNEDHFVTYSENTANNNGGYTILRYLKKNIVWVGDGGFLSCDAPNTRHTSTVNGVTFSWRGVSSNAICPFALSDDNLARPSVKPYGDGNHLANNAGVFANIMVWAIYQAEFYGINSGGLSGL
ncbi:MAG: hypothetical protein LBN24_06490, partial [Mediterranea sp.]|nr:hypothetical protein [Mediterranea sp.]